MTHDDTETWKLNKNWSLKLLYTEIDYFRKSILHWHYSPMRAYTSIMDLLQIFYPLIAPSGFLISNNIQPIHQFLGLLLTRVL